MMLTLSLLMSTAWAQTDALIAHLESKAYLLNGKLIVSSKEPEVLSGLKEEGLQVEKLPTIGDINAEIERLRQKHNDSCIVVLRSDETITDGPITGLEITEVGNCTIDPDLRFVIKDNGSQWDVQNNQGDSVSVHTFATVCEDLPLQARLNYEDTVASRNGRILYYGSVGLAVGVLFTTGNPDPGFSPKEENRFWTSVFLLGSASFLYTQRDAPHVYRIDRQEDLQNYYSRAQAQRIIDRTFPAIAEDIIETQEDSANESTEDESSAIETEQKTNQTQELVNPEAEVPKSIKDETSQ